ncbi:hypothetical protein NIIDNTM18_48220 [Mycolicibacterium litorale]|uniref:Uncharacterized protein n=1 Tax=Mycolicibacterium litorale TaxID=758802 RepID=A0A6S6PA20_9MYCO|nr:hypothetical protein NIIDNTM18_48220 [Mycolicibacterium litorale]
MCSAWVPGSVLGRPVSGGAAFSSGDTLASPGFRASFVPRDDRHIKGIRTPIPDRYGTALSYSSEREPTKQ